MTFDAKTWRPLLAAAWAGLGVFLLWDAWGNDQMPGYVLGGLALLAASANAVVMWRRRPK